MAPAVTAQSSTMPRGHVASRHANLNTGACKTLENELADWIAAGGEVRLEVRLDGYEGGRPNRIEVEYSVYHPETGRRAYYNYDGFANAGDQSFERLSIAEIEERIAG